MLDACALRHKEARTKKSDKTRAYFGCTKPGCEFCCHLNRGGDGLFRVSKLVWHTCRPFEKAKIKRSWVAETANEMLQEREHVSPKELQADLRKKHGVDAKPLQR